MTIEADVVWPYLTLAPRTTTPEIVPANTGGGRSITAVEQVVSFDAGYWKIDLKDIPFVSRDQKLAARAIAAGINGRIGSVLVPIYDDGPQDTLPWPVDSQGNFVKGKPAYINPDGTMGPGSTITALMTADAALGAVSVDLFVTRGSELAAGMNFSIGVRLYRIKSVNSSVGGTLTTDSGTVLTDDSGHTLTSDGTAYGLTIVPPLREAATNGQEVNFSMPVCIVRLQKDAGMDAFADDYAGRTLASVTFEEYIIPQ